MIFCQGMKHVVMETLRDPELWLLSHLDYSWFAGRACRIVHSKEPAHFPDHFSLPCVEACAAFNCVPLVTSYKHSSYAFLPLLQYRQTPQKLYVDNHPTA